MDALMAFLTVFTQPQLLLLVGLGTFAGVYVGAIPGLSVTMAVSILISFTFSWDVYPAISLMIGIYMGGVYGGSRTAILLNIPGAPSAIATAMDGYPMAKRGEAGQAIGTTTVMSFFGGFIGIGVLALAAPLVSDFALRFQPRDYMLLAVLGILLVGSLSTCSLLKGIFAGAFGIAIGAVGMDPLTFTSRFTFDIPLLRGGISFIAVMIGMFGVSEALLQLHHVNSPRGYRGINVTYPYKERAAGMVRKDDPMVAAIGAVNTVLFQPDGPVGLNTDYTGFMAAYRGARGQASPGICCLIGTGGVGRAIAFGLLALDATELRLVDRDLAKADALAVELSAARPDIHIAVESDASVAARGATGLLNGTPVGMVGYGGTPLPAPAMKGAEWIFDAIYTPVNTPFLTDARSMGLDAISGYELFFFQGVHAWAHFSGLALDEAALRRSLQEASEVA